VVPLGVLLTDLQKQVPWAKNIGAIETLDANRSRLKPISHGAAPTCYAAYQQMQRWRITRKSA